jgi:DNA-binding protein H-NS
MSDTETYAAPPLPPELQSDAPIEAAPVAAQVAEVHTSEQLAYLNSQAQELARMQAEVQEKLTAAKANSLVSFVAAIREQITGAGYTFEEVLPKINPVKTRAKRGTGKKSAQANAAAASHTYQDPANPENTYKRGPLPAWFKDSMATLSLDPTVKADREKFKAEYLTLVATAGASEPTTPVAEEAATAE